MFYVNWSNERRESASGRKSWILKCWILRWDGAVGSGVYCRTGLCSNMKIVWSWDELMNTIDNKISYDGHSPPSPPSPLSHQTFIISVFCLVLTSLNWPSQTRRQLLNIYYLKLSGDNRRLCWVTARNKITNRLSILLGLAWRGVCVILS